jgi:hypothetical protein
VLVAGKSTARQLLQGNVGGRGGTPGSTPGRAFSAVANHKQPTAPRITRKSFDRAMPGKHLLADELAAGQLCHCSQLNVAPASCLCILLPAGWTCMPVDDCMLRRTGISADPYRKLASLHHCALDIVRKAAGGATTPAHLQQCKHTHYAHE